MQNPGLKIIPVMFVCCWVFCFSLSSCSIPNLETPECSAAKDAVKQLYSFHFGNDMRPSADNLKARDRFLTPDLSRELASKGDVNADYFTASDAAPKTFKIGKCETSEPGKASVQVQLYWRDDMKTVQKEVHVDAILINGVWLVGKVQ